MKEVPKSENGFVCLICREEEPNFLTCCNHNFHEQCLTNWHEIIKNECPYCRSFVTLNGKLSLFLKNIQNDDKDPEIDLVFEEDSEEILSYLNHFKEDERVFQNLIRTNVKSESIKGRFLQLASEKGNFDVVRLLLDHGAQVEAKANDGGTSLMLASKKGHLEVLKLLLDHGAQVEAKDKYGWTSLICASANGHLEVVKLLLDHGALVEAKDNDGETSLIWVSANGNFDVVKLLLDHGALVEAKDNSGWTSLMFASEKGHLDVLKLLLDRGAEKPNFCI